MNMNLTVSFPGGKKVDVAFGGHTVHTDQPASGGGEDTAPAPYDLFLASIASCAGIYVVGFCQNRGVDPSLVRLQQRVEFDPETHLASKIDLDLELVNDGTPFDIGMEVKSKVDAPSSHGLWLRPRVITMP